MRLVGSCARNRHRDLSGKLGKASLYECVDCPGPARDWSRTHGADPFDSNSYNPRCRSCHKKYDACEANHNLAPAIQARWADPEAREVQSKAIEESWSKPEHRAGKLAARRARPDILTEFHWRLIEETLHLPKSLVAAKAGKNVKWVDNARTRLKRRKAA